MSCTQATWAKVLRYFPALLFCSKWVWLNSFKLGDCLRLGRCKLVPEGVGPPPPFDPSSAFNLHGGMRGILRAAHGRRKRRWEGKLRRSSDSLSHSVSQWTHQLSSDSAFFHGPRNVSFLSPDMKSLGGCGRDPCGARKPWSVGSGRGGSVRPGEAEYGSDRRVRRVSVCERWVFATRLPPLFKHTFRYLYSGCLLTLLLSLFNIFFFDGKFIGTSSKSITKQKRWMFPRS